MRFARLAALSFAATFLFVVPAHAASVVNGGFESGLTGWNQAVIDQDSGSWVGYSGTGPLPQSGNNVIAPIAGNSAAASDEFENSSSALYQDVALEAGHTHTFSYKHAWFNQHPVWFTPDPLNFTFAVQNQQIRVDVIKASADPRTADPADMLATSFQSLPATATSSGWTDGPPVDLSAFAGQTVRLRFIYVANHNYLHQSIDEVAIASKNIKPATISSVKLKATKIIEKQAATLSFISDEVGTASVTIERAAAGKRVAKNCVRPNSRNREKRNCVRWVALKGGTSTSVAIGNNKLTLNSAKKLKPGKYRLKLVVTDNGALASNPIVKTFTIVKKKKR